MLCTAGGYSAILYLGRELCYVLPVGGALLYLGRELCYVLLVGIVLFYT